MYDHSNEDELSDSEDNEPEELPCGAPFEPELDDDDDDEGHREAVVCAPSAQSSFTLKGGNSAFSDRSHSIFDSLDSVIQPGHITDGEVVQPVPRCPSGKMKLPPPTESAPPKKRGTPDYLVHPERWTRYSLEDVPETTDQDNRRAAHHFLSSIQKEKKCESYSDIQQRVIFSKPNRMLKEQAADQPSAIRGKKRGMHLSHLDEAEAEEDEDGVDVRGGEKSGGSRTDQSGRETQGGERDEEKDMRRGLDGAEEVSPGITSFKKTKSKIYRKSSEQED